MNRAFFGTHQLTAADFTPVFFFFLFVFFSVNNVMRQAQKQARVQAKKKKYGDMKEAAAAGSATQHQLDLLAVVKVAAWEYKASYA